MPNNLEYKVTCVVVEHERSASRRITQLGGDGWQKKLSDVLYEMGLGTTFYTDVDGECDAEVCKVSPASELPYVRTKIDSELTDNLLKLPRCPKPLV